MPPRSLAEFDAAMTPGAQGHPQAPMPSVDQPAIPIGIPGVEDVVNLPSNLVKGAKALPDVLRNFFSHPKETAKGFVQGASEAATPGRTGLLALLTGGANLPATLAAAGAQAGAEGARVATDAPNAPHSLGDAALDVAGAASTPGLAAAVPAALAKAGGAAQVIKRGLGGALGGYEGYKYGGVPGGVVGALGGAAVGGGDVRLPGRLAPLSDFLAGGEKAAAEAGPGPEATFGKEAVPGAKPGFQSIETPGSSYKGLQKAAGPDLYDLATAEKGPTPAGTPWDAGNGEIIGHTTDTGGSTGLQTREEMAAELARRLGTPSDAEVGLKTAVRNDTGNWPKPNDPMMADVPDFTFEGQNLNGQPPAVGGTEIPGWKGFPPLSEAEMADHINNAGTFHTRSPGWQGMVPTEIADHGVEGLPPDVIKRLATMSMTR